MKIGRVLGLAALAGGGFAAFKVKNKIDELKATYDQVITFSGEEKEYDVFDGAAIAVMFAGLELDLSHAEMVGESATLKIYGEYCGIEIKVPAYWNVKVEGQDEKAGIDNNVVYDGDDTVSKLLIIDYDIKYAGLEIREGRREEGEGYEVEDAKEDDPVAMPDPYLNDSEVEATEEPDMEPEF